MHLLRILPLRLITENGNAMQTIELNGMTFHAFHGVLPQECIVGGRYTVSLRLHADVSAAFDSDDIADTLDYAAAAAIVREEMERPSALIEHVAARIAHSLLQAFPQLDGVDIRLCKLHPPIPGMEMDEACFSAAFHRPIEF